MLGERVERHSEGCASTAQACQRRDVRDYSDARPGSRRRLIDLKYLKLPGSWVSPHLGVLLDF